MKNMSHAGMWRNGKFKAMHYLRFTVAFGLQGHGDLADMLLTT